MSNLSNVFSILKVDAEDDKEQITSITVAKDAKRDKKSGLFFVIYNQN